MYVIVCMYIGINIYIYTNICTYYIYIDIPGTPSTLKTVQGRC